MRRVALFGLAFAVFLMTTSGLLPAHADEWPAKTVRIVTSFPPGTGGDITARVFAESLARRWGKAVIVENRPGAEGAIAVSALLNANDEHTLLFTNGGPVTSNQLDPNKQLSYDPSRDLVPISSAADVFVAIAAPASLNVDSLEAFVRLARSQPGKFNWGGTPGALDYVMPQFFKNNGVDLAHVSYRDVAPAMQDIAQARLQLYAAAVATQLPMVQSGAVRVLAVTNRERTPLLPDAPTAVETGFPELGHDAFLGFFGPRGMRVELQDRIGADIRATGAEPTISERLARNGLIVRTNTPAEFSKIIELERVRLAQIARRLERKTEK